MHPHNPRTPDPRLPYALDYAARGWPVFVLGRSKRPLANCHACSTAGPDHDREACPCLTCHGFYAATLVPDRVRAMLAAHPRGLLALRTGAISGLVVIDIDPRHGGRLDPDLMPPTACVASGGADHGWHLLYTHPGGYLPSRELPGHPGIDVKGDGGYVVLPPSIHPDTGRPYRWARDREIHEMHPSLATLVLAPVADTPPTPPRLHPDHRVTGARTGRHDAPAGGGCISSPSALLAAHLDAVARAPEGRRRRTLYGAARGVARMIAAGVITEQHAWDVLTTAGHNAGQTPAQTRNAIHRRLHRRRHPHPRTDGQLMPDTNPGESGSLGERRHLAAVEPGKAAPVWVPDLWDARQLMATDFPAPKWAVPGIVCEGLSLLAGPPKVGKSWLSLDLALSVAGGGQAFGSDPGPSRSGALPRVGGHPPPAEISDWDPARRPVDSGRARYRHRMAHPPGWGSASPCWMVRHPPRCPSDRHRRVRESPGTGPCWNECLRR